MQLGRNNKPVIPVQVYRFTAGIETTPSLACQKYQSILLRCGARALRRVTLLHIPYDVVGFPSARAMHPAPSLVEAFPKSEDPRAPPPPPPQQHQQQQQQQHHQQQHLSQSQTHQQDQHQGQMQAEDHSVQPQQQQQPLTHHQPENHMPASPDQSPQPSRKDTASSTSTNVTDATAVTNASSDTNATIYSVESSQSIFSVKDGAEISNSRRASRRRTGPLSAQQREKAALIRKLGACQDCRRRRVAVSWIFLVSLAVGPGSNGEGASATDMFYSAIPIITI